MSEYSALLEDYDDLARILPLTGFEPETYIFLKRLSVGAVS